MKTNLAFLPSELPRRHPAWHPAILVLLALLASLPSVSRAAVAGGGTKITSCLCYYPNGTTYWVLRSDPQDVQSFRFTVLFDPNRAQLNTSPDGGVIFKQPFSGTVDTSQAAAGRIVISGNTATANVTPGDVDTFEIIFNDLQPGLPINGTVFTVGGVDPADFIGTFDPSTNTTGTISSAAIGVVSRSVTPGEFPMIWDPDLTYNNGTTGGAGIWDLSSATRFDRLPIVLQNLALANVSWNNTNNQHDVAVFGGNPGTGLVNVQANISVGGLRFDMPGYQLSGGTLMLSPAAGSAATVEIRDGAATLNTVLADSGTISSGLRKIGPGTLVLAGPNTFTGATTISAGAVQISTDQNLGAAPGSATPGMLVLNGGTLRVTSAMTLNPNRGVNLSPANGTIDVAAGGSLLYAGVIEGPGALTKVGGGTLTFAGSNTFAGNTTIVAGALVNNGSLASGVEVQSGRLSGGGTISGAVIVGDGVGGPGDAMLRPASAGVPTTMLLGGLSLKSDAVFQLTLNSSTILADQLLLGGNAILGNGIAQLTTFDAAPALLPIGTTFTVLKNQFATTSGFFSGLPDGAFFTEGLNTYQIDYNAGSSFNDVQITVAPEPGTSLLLTAALVLAGGARRLRLRRD